MTNAPEVICRPLRKRTLWFFAGLGAAGAVLAAVGLVYGSADVWPAVGLLLAASGILPLHRATSRVSADAHGLHSRTLLRRRSVPWRDIADLRVYLKYENVGQGEKSSRVSLLLRDGRKRLLPLPRAWAGDDPDFEAKLDSLRALHRRYGDPESDETPVISSRSAGHSRTGSLAVCALLLAGAAVAAGFVSDTASDERAWKSAVPCTAGTSAELGRECLTTLPAVIARSEAERPKQTSWLYLADSRPVERIAVPYGDALAFRSGDSVELTLWRGKVMKVAGERRVWHEHVPRSSELAAIAAACALAAGYPGARALLGLRGRRLPDDEVLPSALPFVGALAGTGLWLLPLCYVHPTDPLTSPAAVTWAAVGSSATLGLFLWAWRATRVRTPERTGTAGKAAGAGEEPAGEVRDVFVAARFLEHTDYNPHGFGTHIVLGDGPPAVTPHSGPGRFAAVRIPVERLTVKGVRRVRGSDGDALPRSWHIAELDDAGEPVHLAALPADLTRIIRELSSRDAVMEHVPPSSCDDPVTGTVASATTRHGPA